MEENKIEQKSSSKLNLVIDFLYGKYWLLLAQFTLMVALMKQTSTLVSQVSVIKDDPYYSTLLAFGIDIAIFTFTIHGRSKSAFGILFMLLLLCISFFNMDTFFAHWSVEWVKFWITTILSLVIIFCLHAYVMIFKDKQEEVDEVSMWQESARKKNEELNEAKQNIHKMEKDMERLRKDLASNQEDLKALIDQRSVNFTPVLQQMPLMESDSKSEKRIGNEKKKYFCEDCQKSALTERSFNIMKKNCGTCSSKTESSTQDQVESSVLKIAEAINE